MTRGTFLFVASDQTTSGLALSYKRAFEALGIDAVLFDLEQQRLDVTSAPRRLEPIVGRVLSHLDSPVVAHKADLALVRAATKLRPAGILVFCNEPIRPATLLHLKVTLPDAKLANVYPDTMFNMRENVIAALPLYDAFATHTEAGIASLRQLGCRNPVFLPLAADPTLHAPETLTPEEARELACDLVFVGNWRPEREALLAHLEGMDLSLYGAWENAKGWVRSRWRGPALMGSRFAKAHAAAKIGLNLIDPLNFPGHNMRSFEIPACRAFGIATGTPEMKELFREGVDAVFFETGEELRAKAREYLARPEDRRRIANAAYERVVHGGHTYEDRSRALLDALGLGPLAS